MIIKSNLDFILGIVNFFSEITPVEVKNVGAAFVSAVFGFPTSDLLGGENTLRSVIETLLYVPSIVLFFLTVWIILYYIENYGFVEGNLVEVQDPDTLHGPLFFHPVEEAKCLLVWTATLAKGILKGLDSMRGVVIKAMLIPLLILYILSIVLNHV